MLYTVSIYAKPNLGFPGGYIDGFYGNRGDALRWIAANNYDSNRYETIWY